MEQDKANAFTIPVRPAVVKKTKGGKTGRPMGAPKKDPEDRLTQKSGRMLPRQWEKMADRGGWEWLRSLVDRAP